jgi:hypothetical protein
MRQHHISISRASGAGPSIADARRPGTGLAILAIAFALVCAPERLWAQESEASAPAQSEEKDPEPEPEAEKNLRFSIIGGPFYNSKVQWAVGAAPLLTFSMDRADVELQRSTITFPFSISTNGSYSVAAAARLFWPDDRMRGIGALLLKDGPNLYWGRGYESGANPDNEEQYQGSEGRFAWTQEWRVREHLYTGGGFDFTYKEAQEYPDDGLIANETNAPRSFNSGLTGIVSYDSRDVVSNAYSGMLMELEVKLFRTWIGGDYEYERYRLDYRGYHKISQSRNFAIAWQLLTERASGDVPWQELPALGSPREMRAYFLDRFRDNWRILGQFELRLHEIVGRHGLAFWVAAGTVAPRLSDARIGEMLAEVGVGYRFRMQPRQNARIDLAIGRGSIGFVLNVLEAF